MFCIDKKGMVRARRRTYVFRVSSNHRDLNRLVVGDKMEMRLAEWEMEGGGIKCKEREREIEGDREIE